MRFFNERHRYYCGIDLHAHCMYLCILDQDGNILLHKNLPTDAERFLQTLEPYKPNVVVAVESTFSWYWLADLCADHSLPFILGHALYMKAIHGAKAKNDRLDSLKIATLLRGGAFPLAYVYPRSMRAMRDLLRRRMYLTHHRGELLGHIEQTNIQHNLPAFEKRIKNVCNRQQVSERFSDPSVQRSVDLDMSLIQTYDRELQALEVYILQSAKEHDRLALQLLQTISGVGKILALVIYYEIGDIQRFPRHQEFLSYSRLVKCQHESAGKKLGSGGGKIGNAYLKWAFNEAACLYLRYNPKGKAYRDSLMRKHGKTKSLAILARRLGTAAYYVLKRRKPFDPVAFLGSN